MCKTCAIEAATRWQKEHPERLRATRRARYARQHDELSEKRRAYEKRRAENDPESVERKRLYNAAYARRRRLAEFGVNEEHFAELMLAQGGACAICERTDEPLCFDHDHDTDRPRALLCGRCNRGLGMFDDDPDQLRAAAVYLEQHETRNVEVT